MICKYKTTKQMNENVSCKIAVEIPALEYE